MPAKAKEKELGLRRKQGFQFPPPLFRPIAPKTVCGFRRHLDADIWKGRGQSKSFRQRIVLLFPLQFRHYIP